MATVKISLDTRAANKHGEFPLKLVFSHHNRTAQYSLDLSVLPQHWDAGKMSVIRHSDKEWMNLHLQHRLLDARHALLELGSCGVLRNKSVTQIRDMVIEKMTGKKSSSREVTKHYEDFISRRQSKRTQDIYKDSLTKLRKYLNKSTLTFDDINKKWLEEFRLWLYDNEGLSTNTVSIHLRNLRAVVNDAIDNELTTTYGFRNFHIKTEQTPKRSLTLSQIRTIFNVEPILQWEQKYIDCFRLMFLLIGINPIDLLTDNMHIVNGRLEYKRSKTGRFYSVKIEPEAMEIINRYKGDGDYVVSFAQGMKSYRHFANRMNLALKRYAPGLTAYWARHTWATIAAKIDVPKDVIAMALGHGKQTVTDIYINFDLTKIDDANRRVIDYIRKKHS